MTRQVDPLHSCIEAKCSSWKSTEYLNCIYHHCINGMESSSSRFGREITERMRRRMREGTQAKRMASWRMVQMGSRTEQRGKTPLGNTRRVERGIFPGKILLGSRAERIMPGMMGSGFLMRGSDAEQLVPVVASLPAGAFLGLDEPVRRRGFNDISDVCKERNCGPYQQTVEYFNCIENIVDCPSLSR